MPAPGKAVNKPAANVRLKPVFMGFLSILYAGFDRNQPRLFK
jgi:hypothetical protein